MENTKENQWFDIYIKLSNISLLFAHISYSELIFSVKLFEIKQMSFWLYDLCFWLNAIEVLEYGRLWHLSPQLRKSKNMSSNFVGPYKIV